MAYSLRIMEREALRAGNTDCKHGVSNKNVCRSIQEALMRTVADLHSKILGASPSVLFA